jgi:hypothetical protein
MKIEFNKMTIQLTNTEAKKASNPNEEMYKTLLAIKRDYPTFKVVVAEPRKSKRTDTLKGLNYTFMENYIKINKEEKLKEFNQLRFNETAQGLKSSSISYGEIKQWFLMEFPEILNKRNEIKQILAASKKY